MSPHDIIVDKIVDNPDGSATITFDMSVEALKVFAAIGLQQLLIEKAKEIVDGHSDAKGSGDAGSGERGDPDFHEQFPGF
jgi:hypothetical protein